MSQKMKLTTENQIIRQMTSTVVNKSKINNSYECDKVEFLEIVQDRYILNGR